MEDIVGETRENVSHPSNRNLQMVGNFAISISMINIQETLPHTP